MQTPSPRAYRCHQCRHNLNAMHAGVLRVCDCDMPSNLGAPVALLRRSKGDSDTTTSGRESGERGPLRQNLEHRTTDSEPEPILTACQQPPGPLARH